MVLASGRPGKPSPAPNLLRRAADTATEQATIAYSGDVSTVLPLLSSKPKAATSPEQRPQPRSAYGLQAFVGARWRSGSGLPTSPPARLGRGDSASGGDRQCRCRVAVAILATTAFDKNCPCPSRHSCSLRSSTSLRLRLTPRTPPARIRRTAACQHPSLG